jgi:hypothetical protein
MKQPKFFCENCKKEVSVRDKICPHCGKFFSDVRCPKCNFTGTGDLFYSGCPKCGYLNPALMDGSGGNYGDIEIVNLDAFESRPVISEKRKTVPAWFFLAVTLALAFILSVLLYFYLNL